MFSANANKTGFQNKLLASNLKPLTHFNNLSPKICFLNYDLMDKKELFSKKENNPLRFPKQLFIEVEKKYFIK